GGLVISFTVLSFLLETKDMIFLGLYVATIASTFVIITDHKSFSKKMFVFMFPIAFVGTILGVLLFSYLSNIILLKVFALFLLIFSLKSLFFDKVDIKNLFFQRIFLFFGGLLQGLFGTGGPFTVMAIKDKFSNKSQLRTTMASFFIVFNLVRVVQLTIQGSFDADYILSYWWLVFVLFVSIYTGYKIHLKINEHYFKLGINTLILFASIVLLVR
ncbi:unnamed protein product, partial [marine sediment metagenome]